jgi:integrase/recombinase XerD
MPPALLPALSPHHQKALVPAVVTAAGDDAVRRFIEFFTAQIRNPRTRRAYGFAVSRFFAWCEGHGLGLAAIGPVHVAAYIEQLGQGHSAPTVKQHLAAIRMLCDWLVVGHVLPHNPATAVRGPKHVVRQGKTPVPSTEEARALLDRIPVQT